MNAIAALALAVTPFSASAQKDTMSLRDCMAYAVSNSAEVRSQRTKTGDAALDRRDAVLAAFTPEIEGNTYGYFGWGRSIDPETNTYVTEASFTNGLSVTAQFTLFNGFSAINNMKIAKTSLAMGFSKEQQEEDKVCLATMEAYFNVLYYSRLADILASQVETAKASVALAERQEELGVKGYADVAQMRADLSGKEYEYVAAVNSRDNAVITLGDVMLWPVDEELVIDSDINALESGNAIQVPVTDIIGSAKSKMPSIFVAKNTMDNAALSIRTERWKFLPSVGLYAGWSTSYYTYPGKVGYVTVPYADQFRNNAGEYVQLSVRIPIYDRLNQHTRLAKRKNEYRRASDEYDKTLREVESEVKRAVRDRDGAEAALMQAEKRAAAQDEVWKLNQKKFGQGLISSIEYGTASGDYLKAQAEYLKARLEYQLKRRVVEYYGGTRYLEQ